MLLIGSKMNLKLDPELEAILDRHEAERKLNDLPGEVKAWIISTADRKSQRHRPSKIDALCDGCKEIVPYKRNGLERFDSGYDESTACQVGDAYFDYTYICPNGDCQNKISFKDLNSRA